MCGGCGLLGAGVQSARAAPPDPPPPNFTQRRNYGSIYDGRTNENSRFVFLSGFGETCPL